MKIAIIGSGISGLGSAYILHKHHDITLYEKNKTLGGHSRTVTLTGEDKTPVPVDTGFIVFNYLNYPHLSAMFQHLDVPVILSNMSFGASIDNSWLEYSTQSLSSIFAQKRNIFNVKFIKMLLNILYFNKNALRFIDKYTSLTLGEFLAKLGMGEWFKNYFILAVGGAIWSMPIKQMLDYPAKTFVQFFHNHGLLTVNKQPQWYTVKGGSVEYVKIISSHFKDSIKLNCGAKKITKTDNGIIVLDENGEENIYDNVILACHSDQALNLIENPTHDETEVLSAIKYKGNQVVLHDDESFMPKSKKAWASWVYLSKDRLNDSNLVSLSYWMNRLQSLSTKKDVFITLNPFMKPNYKHFYNEHTFEHPVFDTGAIEAQKNISKIQGKRGIWFCGAWQGYGFHEDGLKSAVEVCKQIGVETPWKV